MKMTNCPKCLSPNVFMSKTGVGWDQSLHVLMSGVLLGAAIEAMEPTYDWETYLCTDCGYFENYVTDNDWLKKIKAGRSKNWRKAESTTPAQ